MDTFIITIKFSIRPFCFLLLFFLFSSVFFTGCTNSREGVKEENIKSGEEILSLSTESKEEIRQQKRTLFAEIEEEKANIDNSINHLNDAQNTQPISDDSVAMIMDRMKHEKKKLSRQADRIESANFESWESTKNEIINTIEEVKGNMELLVVKDEYNLE